MPHFGLCASGGMASAYGQTPPSPPLHNAGPAGGGGNGVLLPPSPPHHQVMGGHQHHQLQHQHQYQQHNHSHHQQQQSLHPHSQAHLSGIPRTLVESSGNANNGGGGSISLLGSGLNTSNVANLSNASAYRTQIEDKKLSREAMERYMRDRNDMVIVILHAKVSQRINHYSKNWSS